MQRPAPHLQRPPLRRPFQFLFCVKLPRRLTDILAKFGSSLAPPCKTPGGGKGGAGGCSLSVSTLTGTDVEEAAGPPSVTP
eukprot:7588247-Heterocapsa_arctica.AAC.1